jgi:Insertion element 4 transposase N-terminal/Transposase DDE domain
VAKSAMAGAVVSAVDSGDAGDAGGLRTAVLAGPGAVLAAEDQELFAGAVRLLADGQVITAALARERHVDLRKRVLTGAVTVAVILGLCLFRKDNYDLVLARMLATLAPGTPPPTGQALSPARARLVGQPLRAVFEATAGPGQEPTQGSRLFGLLATVFDGTVIDLAATDDNAAEFAIPAGGTLPQARMVTLVTCGTRRVIAAAVDSSAVSEQALVDQLTGALVPGTLNLADRNFFSLQRWVTFAATGAQLAWRVKNGAKSLPATVIQQLPDASQLVRLRESASMLARRRAKAGDRTLPRLPDTTARLVEFLLTVTDAQGRTRTSRFRILTTLLDHTRYPANQLAQAYAERWQAEITYHHLKTTLRGADTTLRGHTPQLARQELWGLLTVYNALVDHAVRTAINLGIDPDQISFTVVLALTRNALTTDTTCPGCGHRPSTHHDLAQALTDAIATQPRNRTNRNRTSPRTTTQRKTERTRNVTYTITITPSNLPQAE